MLHDNKDVRLELRISEKEKSDFLKALKINNDNLSRVLRGFIFSYTMLTFERIKNENK